MNADPEFQRLGGALKEAEDALRDVEQKLEATNETARLRVVKGKWRAFYRARDIGKTFRDGTNIRDDVLAAISRHINVRLLKDSQVEDLARELIKMFAEANPEYKALEGKRKRLESDREIAQDRYNLLTYRGRYAQESTYHLKNEIEQIEKQLTNPATARLAEKRMRERAAIPDKTREIFEELTKK